MNNNYWKPCPEEIDLDDIMNEINGIEIERDVKRTIKMNFSDSKENSKKKNHDINSKENEDICFDLTRKEESNEQSYYSNNYWSRPIEEINISDLLI